MTTEFNLNESREKVWKYLEESLVPKTGWGIPKRIMQQIKDQDKEFIRLLKEKFGEWIFETEDLASAFSIIDKLAGLI